MGIIDKICYIINGENMKKILFLVLVLFLTSCDFESNVENCRSELFSYDIATCKSAWRSTTCYAVDLDSDKMLKVYKDSHTNTPRYEVGTYTITDDNVYHYEYWYYSENGEKMISSDDIKILCEKNSDCSGNISKTKNLLDDTFFYSSCE